MVFAQVTSTETLKVHDMRVVNEEIHLHRASTTVSKLCHKTDDSKSTKTKDHHTLGPYCLINHSDVLGFDASNMVLSRPRRPTIFAIRSARTESTCLQTSSASIIIMSAPASKHLSALRIKRSTSSTNSDRYKEKAHAVKILL